MLLDYIEHWHEHPYWDANGLVGDAQKQIDNSFDDERISDIPSKVASVMQMLRTVERLNSGALKETGRYRWTMTHEVEIDSGYYGTNYLQGWLNRPLSIKSDDGTETQLHFPQAVRLALSDIENLAEQGACLHYARTNVKHADGKCGAYPCAYDPESRIDLEQVWQLWEVDIPNLNMNWPYWK